MFVAAGDDDEVWALALGMLRRLVVFVEDLADDLLEKIFHRHESRRAAEFVEHDRHMLLEPLEVGEHFLDLARARHDVHGPHDRAQREIRRWGAENRDQVLRQDQPDDVVDRLLVHGISRPAALLDERQRLVERRSRRRARRSRSVASSPHARSFPRTRIRPRACRRLASAARRPPGFARRASAALRRSGRSLRGSDAFCPNARSTTCDDRLSRLVNGVTIHANPSSGGVSHLATLSGCDSAAPRGASSPNTTWKNVTMVSAIAAPIPTRTDRSIDERQSIQPMRPPGRPASSRPRRRARDLPASLPTGLPSRPERDFPKRAARGAPSSRRFAPSTRGASGVIEPARTRRQRRSRSRAAERRWRSGARSTRMNLGRAVRSASILRAHGA